MSLPVVIEALFSMSWRVISFPVMKGDSNAFQLELEVVLLLY